MYACVTVCVIKVAKHRITQTMPHNSQVTQFSNGKDLGETQMGSPQMEVPNAGGVG